MEADLTGLEQKIEGVLSLCDKLREENRALRGRVTVLEGEKQVLTEKIDTTLARLEALMDRLPEQ
jgi:cell division protein ZapB